MFRRGFKSQCERRAVEIRRTLSLDPTDPLHAETLARHLEITVWADNQINGVPKKDLNVLNSPEAECWSALTIRKGTHHVIVYKHSQSPPRVNSVIMHELAHIMLGHELISAGLTKEKHLIPSNYNQEQEDEADWLGGTLLLPRPALVLIRKNKIPDEVAMKEYQVSKEMLTWRIRMTGVDYQMAHARRKKFNRR